MPTLAEMIEPMPGKLAVQVDTKDQITPQGLYIPEGVARSIHEQRPTQGVVIAIAEDDKDYDGIEEDAAELGADPDIPMTKPFAIGDRVVFGRYSGVEITYWPDRTKNKEKIIILKNEDILCRLKTSDEVTVKG
jgi:co-chaperonin GroES (HSP10)